MEIQDKEIFREDEIFIRDMVICIKFAKKASVLSCARQEERTLCIHTFLRDRNDDNNVGVYVRGERKSVRSFRKNFINRNESVRFL